MTRYGYDDVPTTVKVGTGHRLDRLARHVEAWKEPNFDLSGATDVNAKWNGSTYELQGGMFISGESNAVGSLPVIHTQRRHKANRRAKVYTLAP